MKIPDFKFPISKIGLSIPAFLCLAVGWLCYVFVLSPLPGIPSFEKVQAAYVKSEGILLDRNGDVIHEMRVHGQGRRLDWTALRDISPALQSAIVCAEDQRFYSHGGVDWISAGAALTEVFRARKTRGASTITMQLAALLDKNLKPDRSRRSLLEKIRQVRAARAYEVSWSKSHILEAYLNLVTFRGELQGVASAARGLFSKEPQGLNGVESVILTALLRAPNADSVAVAQRAHVLARSLHLPLQYLQIETAAREILEQPYYVRPQIASITCRQ